ncbi:MAG: HlyD family secretion protein [Pseudomonadota bacterium]
MPPPSDSHDDHHDSSGDDAGKSEDNDKDGNHAGGKEDENKGEKKKPSPLKNPKVRIGLAILAVVVLVAGAIWFVHYWRHGRFEQKTNDAYLQADQVSIASKVPGYVEQVLVTDNQQVQPGQPLVRIDERDVRAKFEQAQAQVDQGLANIAQVDAQLHQQQAQIALATAQYDGAVQAAKHAQEEVDRYAPLTAQGAQTAEQLDRMKETRDNAVAQVAAARAQRENAVRQTGTLRAQTAVARAQIEQAQAQVRQSQADLGSTVVRSSIAGRVGDRTVRVGQYVQPGTRMMSVVPVDDVYLVANFKETQIGLMRAGQPATIEVDALSGSALHGTVESFSPGTGAQFALLPPQNATGNFTKVVQRVPVRIHIDAGPEARRVLVPGLSVTVTVDTLGAKQEHQAAKRESKNDKDQREDQHDSQVKRDRDTPTQPGPGK